MYLSIMFINNYVFILIRHAHKGTLVSVRQSVQSTGDYTRGGLAGTPRLHRWNDSSESEPK